MPFLRYFLLDIVSTKRQKVPMDARRWILLSSIDFPSMTLMTNLLQRSRLLDIPDLEFDQYSMTLQFQLS
jgi:hypothetical protein